MRGGTVCVWCGMTTAYVNDRIEWMLLKDGELRLVSEARGEFWRGVRWGLGIGIIISLLGFFLTGFVVLYI